MTQRGYRAPVYRFEEGKPLRVDALFGERDTPGQVGVCLSGGGSRAMCAAMGQLRGLAQLSANGKSLLSQVKALSTVSGGSWCGVPFVYLREDTPDELFLGKYVADPGRLVPHPLPGHQAHEVIGLLPAGNIGRVAANPAFGPAGLALEMLILRSRYGLPQNRIWASIIGHHVFEPYGLCGTPTDEPSLFTHDGITLTRDVVAANPFLAETSAHLYADANGSTASRIERPYLICNTAMFLKQDEGSYRPLAPVQVTPLFVGIVGGPEGVDANGNKVGPAAVAPFAFDSDLSELDGDFVQVTQQAPFALADAAASSSAFFAEMMQNLFVAMRDDPAARERIRQKGCETARAWLADKLPAPWTAGRDGNELVDAEDMRKMEGALAELCQIIPEYRYWPVHDPQPGAAVAPTRFADGGSLENTGIAGLLAYTDIDRVISFVNSRTPLAAAEHGILTGDGSQLPNTAIMIDPQVPPLFGYQPYREEIGYIPYAGDPDPAHPEFGRNQLFEGAAFAELLQALWRESGNAAEPGSHARPAIAQLSLRVLTNRWFGVIGRGGGSDKENRPLDLILVYTTHVRKWYDQLSASIQRKLGDFDDPSSFHAFPHYSTANIQLPADAVNLLAHLTAWSVAAPENAERFIGMFQRHR